MPLAALRPVFLGFPQGLPGGSQCRPSCTSFPGKLTRGLRNGSSALMLELHWPPLSSEPTSMECLLGADAAASIPQGSSHLILITFRDRGCFYTEHLPIRACAIWGVQGYEVADGEAKGTG